MLYFAKWKVGLILATVFVGVMFALPNVFDRDSLKGWPDSLPNQQINLGLDLQGGSHLLLEVDVAAVTREKLEALVDETRTELRKAKIGYVGLGITGASVSVKIRKAGDLEAAKEALSGLAQPLNATLLGGGTAVDLEVTEGADNRLLLTLTEEGIAQKQKAAVDQSIEIVRRRIDELGTREPTIQRQGSDRILVQLPGEDNPQRIKNLLGQTAKLVFRLVDMTVSPADLAAGRVPPGSEILPDDADPNQKWAIRKRVMVSGENLVDAQPGFDQQQNVPAVFFRFDAAGARRFGEATRKNVGRPFAIVLDGKVVSAPRINEPILGGSGQITGNFTVESANDLAILLRAGALPAPLNVLEERSVGPDLGADSVNAGKIASMIAFVAVIAFMVLSYGMIGFFANIALIINMILLAGVLSGFQATLTLPGIAGIVLTIGMAVDANVLIFERIREELRAGKTAMNAVEAGYQRALGTILDANITTFIAAAILFSMGSGPIRGFAVTLAIGILTSVFTAFTLTRLMAATWLKNRKQKPLVI